MWSWRTLLTTCRAPTAALPEQRRAKEMHTRGQQESAVERSRARDCVCRSITFKLKTHIYKRTPRWENSFPKGELLKENFSYVIIKPQILTYIRLFDTQFKMRPFPYGTVTYQSLGGTGLRRSFWSRPTTRGNRILESGVPLLDPARQHGSWASSRAHGWFL